MQLMSDALTVLGSRHGVFIEPVQHRSSLIRSDRFPGTPCGIRAGAILNGRILHLPLCEADAYFDFCDQDTSPCAMTLTGVDPVTAHKLQLTITIPFRPRDGAFSTTPVLDLELQLLPLDTHFRWTTPEPLHEPASIFLEIPPVAGAQILHQNGVLNWQFDADCFTDRDQTEAAFRGRQCDAIVLHQGEWDGQRASAQAAQLESAETHIHASWCTWSEPLLRVHSEPAPFKYTEQFASLEDVITWVKRHPDALRDNRERVNGILQDNNLSRSTNNLAALTLHSWLANTWWTCPDGQDWFTVWEGSCYFHSTVDVEYTQAPFYLSVWPELLGYELDQWPQFVTPGENIIGEPGKGTVVFMHDVGELSAIDTTRYNHPMPVEENTNYILMSYGYWRRSADDTRVRRNANVIEQALDFLVACDTTGNGVPNLGMANTIDDASPAVQFGKEQVYLAVKTLAAFEVGADMLEHAGRPARCATYRNAAAKIAAVVNDKGWQQDHFVTLLDKSTHGVVDSWSGTTFNGNELPGWDASHIYTANGLVLLDMVGRHVDVDEQRLTEDLVTATQRCLDRYGCRHSDFKMQEAEIVRFEGGTFKRTCRIGWISMNMLRDMAAFYRGVDLRALADRYWEFQVLTNTQGPHLFFETFNGNNLMCYPRGIAIFGYFDALAGLRLDRVAGTMTVAPLDPQIVVPLLPFADWKQGTAPNAKRTTPDL